MKLTKKTNVILAINVFLAIGVSVALVLSVVGTRRGISTIREEAYQAFLMEDLSIKTRQWAISMEPLLRGDLAGGQDLYYLNTLYLEENLSSLKVRPLSREERELVERVSSRFYVLRSQIEKLLAGGRLYAREVPLPTLIKEIAGGMEELLGDVEALRARRKRA